MSTLIFPCGCEFPVDDGRDERIMRSQIDELPLGIKLDPYNIRHDCGATWDLLSQGRTKGVFQLEGNLGQTWAAKIKPENLEELSALISAIRPGVLKAKSGDPPKSMTQRYKDRKLGLEPVEYYVPELEPILKNVYGILLYQENSMQISVSLAGFNEQDADILRKCVTDDTAFVSKTRGWITIKQLLQDGYKDDEFLVMDECGIQQWKKIENIWCTGKHDVNRVEVESGMFVNATKHHQFLTNHGWVARSRLNSDDYIVATNSVEYDGKDIISKDLAFIIAGIITEGYFVRNKTSTFVNHDKIMMGWFTKAFNKVFGEDPRFDKEHKVARLLKKHKDVVAQYMKFGLSDKKCIPQVMMGMTKDSTRDFLSFMFSAEAHFNTIRSQIEFASKSYTLVHQIQLLLLRFGIRSLINSRDIENYDTHYRLYINDRIDQYKFAKDLTTFLLPSKLEALNNIVNKEYIASYTKDMFPHNIVTQMLDQYPYVGNYEGGSVYSKPISRQRFKRLAENTNDNYWMTLTNGEHRYDKIRSLDQRKRETKTYDFSMRDNTTPYIIANGLVIHNSIGKKKPEIMAKVSKKFIDGCKQTGIVTKEQAEEIFSWIRESQKYGFCKSHGVSYAEGSYWTAYCKTHFPLQFFCSYLRGANWKQDKYEEIATLVNDAKLFNIKVNPPDLRDIQTNFYIKNQELYFGLLEVKQVGESSIVKIQHALKEVQLTLDRQIDNWSWLDYLIFFSDKISSSINKSLILTGAIDFFGESRTLMLYHMDCWTQLTKKEKAWIQTKQYESTNNARWTTLHDALCDCAHKKADGGGCHTVRRIQVMQSVGNILRNPPHSLSDSFHFMAWNEEKLLGLPLTCNMVDDCDSAIQANTTCKELLDGKDGYIILAVTINRIKEIHTKKAKKKMAFLTVSDNTYALDSIVCFPDDWKEFKDLLTVSNTVLLHVETSKKGSFIIKQVWQI